MTKTGGNVVDDEAPGGGGGGGIARLNQTQYFDRSVNVREKGRNQVVGLSNGTGRGGGIGSGSGTGTGSGSGYGSGSGSGAGGAPPPPRTISGGVMNGKAVNLPKPAYPQAASAVGASGSVSVQVTIDESGNVISAVPVSGHPLLRAAAAQAANGATFTPTMMSGQPVKVTGVITYNFGTSGTTIVAKPGEPVGALTPAVALTPEQLREKLHKQKLHAWLYAAVVGLEKKTSPTPNESAFVRDGRASVSLTLTRPASAKLIEELRALGFEVEKVAGTSVTGAIAVEKLRELADVEEIKYILPRVIDRR